jgi:hypothetical protein
MASDNYEYQLTSNIVYYKIDVSLEEYDTEITMETSNSLLNKNNKKYILGCKCVIP